MDIYYQSILWLECTKTKIKKASTSTMIHSDITFQPHAVHSMLFLVPATPCSVLLPSDVGQSVGSQLKL